SITFMNTPDDQTGRESSDHMIICGVRADPLPIISWYVNGSLIVDGPRRTITEDGLYIRNMKPSDAGNYTCRAFVVTKHNSQIKDKHITVHVHYRPVWKNPDVDTFYGVIGSIANLTCEAQSQPPPTFEWFRGRTLLGNSQIYRIINGMWKSVIQVKIKDHSSFGIYVCLVSNTIGEIQREMSLLEGVLPNPPTFTLSSEEPGILVVKIFQSPYDSLPLTGYKIKWKQITDLWKHAREYLTSKGNEFVIQDLNFDTEYAVRVSARNAIGFSNFTETQVQRTKGLVAETVVDGSSVLSSTFNGCPRQFSVFHHLLSIAVTSSVVIFDLIFHSSGRIVS
ncbi:neural cell adhesion molecule 1-B-like, partial [Stegodyphus dumicola]|uniref:neural cell adhesion molecule 1-B-like n=1 Tax=Stegodyphus dumicola TaxID=202533 RepID=UPI0015A8868D